MRHPNLKSLSLCVEFWNSEFSFPDLEELNFIGLIYDYQETHVLNSEKKTTPTNVYVSSEKPVHDFPNLKSLNYYSLNQRDNMVYELKPHWTTYETACGLQIYSSDFPFEAFKRGRIIRCAKEETMGKIIKKDFSVGPVFH